MLFSRLLNFHGHDSVLTATYNPSIELPKNVDLGVALVSFNSFYSIANITEENNNFYFADKYISLPKGVYDLDDISNWIKRYADPKIDITLNMNTLKVEIISPVDIHFDKPKNFGSLLGYSRKVLLAGLRNVSDELVKLHPVSTINIECSIASGSYKNSKSCHVIHEFTPDVPFGYKILQRPKRIYLPIINNSSVHDITLRVTDQNHRLLDFRNESINIVLHLQSF